MKIEIVKFNELVYDWESLVNYMNDGIRNQVHDELAPCTNEEFLERYLELDSEFKNCFHQMLKYDEVYSIDKGWIADDGLHVSYEIDPEYFTNLEEAEEAFNNVEIEKNDYKAIQLWVDGELEETLKFEYTSEAKEIIDRVNYINE